MGDFLLQKKFLPKHSEEELHLEGISQIGEIAWCIRERFLVQLELGSGEFHWKQPDLDLSGKTENGLIWNGDAKLLIFEVKDTFVAIDGQAGGWDWMDGTLKGSPQIDVNETKLRYWQFGAAVTQKISFFFPYGGVVVNRTRFTIGSPKSEFHAKYTVGPFLGCSLTNGSKFFINLEWRGWFEEGLSLSGLVRF